MTVSRRLLLKYAGLGALEFGAVSSFPVWAWSKSPRGNMLRGTPIAENISPSGVHAFISAAAESGHELHSLMIARRGKVVVEAWWDPYRAGAIHLLNSLSKSFTSTAVGFAVMEGRLTLDDRVIAFFPDKTPSEMMETLVSLQVRHLLTMSTGHSREPRIWAEKEKDWVKAFLSAPIEYAPGTIFLYNSAATYMLSAIVQKVSGQKLVDYLEPRLFGPLDILEKKWAACPMGINTGGWGLSLTTEAVVKFGQLYLQNGQWNGRQLLSKSWVQEATSLKIQRPPATSSQNPDWHRGYGYQFWLSTHGFRADGAKGQFCIVLPEQDAVIAITSCTTGMQGLLNLVWEHILPAMHNRPPSMISAQRRLESEIASLTLPLPARTFTPLRMAPNRTFKLEASSLNVDSVVFHFQDNTCVLTFIAGESTAEVQCGFGRWLDSVVENSNTLPKLFGVNDPGPIKVAAAGAWRDERTLEMHWRFYETPNHDIVICRFDGDQVNIEFLSSIARSSEWRITDPRPMLEGHASA